MALSRSASGPGSLSINTGSANSLFGSTATAQSSAGLFGAAPKPAVGGLFGASTAVSSPPAQGGLFGNTGGLFGANNATSSAPSSVSLFGAAPSASQPQQSGSLFGQAAPATQPQQSGGLFGGLNAGAQSQPQQSGSLFGATNQQPQQSGSLFGGSTTNAQPQNGGLFQQPPQAQQSGGLFGGLNSQAQNKPTSSLFGGVNAQAQQPQQQNSLFGGLNKPQQNTGFGGSFGGGLGLGQSQSQPQPSVPGVRIDMNNIRQTTRFNDLHDYLQKGIEDYDKGILAAQARCNEINAIMPSHDEQLSYIPDNVEFLSRKHLGVQSSLEEDAESIAMISGFVKEDARAATISFRAIDNLALPQQYHQRDHHHFLNANTGASENGAAAGDLVNFFSSTADELSNKLSTYRERISELEQHLRSVEAATVYQAQSLTNTSRSDAGREMRELVMVLRDFEQAILGAAGNVGEAREGIQRLQLGGFEAIGGEREGRINGNGKRSGIY